VVDQVAVTDEVDLLDAIGAVGNAGAGEQRVDRAAALVDRRVDVRLVAQVEADRLRTRQRDRRVVHHHDLGTEVLHQFGRRGTHAGGPADDQRPLAVVPECISSHDPRSCRWFEIRSSPAPCSLAAEASDQPRGEPGRVSVAQYP
jgi:hypothetical protein